MAYTTIASRRIPYDINGTEVGWRGSSASVTNTLTMGLAQWLTSAQKLKLNGEDKSGMNWNAVVSHAFWFFFPELTEIEAMSFVQGSYGITGLQIQGSADSTNGMDGTWETAVFVAPADSMATDQWRDDIFAVSFSGPVKCLRFGVYYGSAHYENTIYCVNLFGRKAAGETTDDILFCNSDGNEYTALKDFEDRPEGTTEYGSFKLKNASADKIANDANLQLNHADFLMSTTPSGPWVATLDIPTIAANSYSELIYIKNELDPPLLVLGPKAARVIATVGSWT